MPMKVAFGDFVKESPRVPIQKTHIGRTGVAKNRFKVLEVDEEDEEEVVNVRQWKTVSALTVWCVLSRMARPRIRCSS